MQGDKLRIIPQHRFKDLVPVVFDTAESTSEVEIDVLANIGEGGFATVLKVKRLDSNERYAAKRVLESLKLSQIVKNSMGYREAKILKKLNGRVGHRNVIQFFGLYYVQVASFQYHVLLFLEYMETDLERTMRNHRILPYNTIISYLKQILRGLSYIHAKRIIHCDLKPNNILLNRSGHLKIADFGIGIDTTINNDPYTSIFTPSYQPPESILNIPFSFSADMWAVGCIMYEMLCNTPLFPEYSMRCPMQRIIRVVGKPSQAEWQALNCTTRWEDWDDIRSCNWVYPQINHQASTLMLKMLAFIPSQRITAVSALHDIIFCSTMRF